MRSFIAISVCCGAVLALGMLAHQGFQATPTTLLGGYAATMSSPTLTRSFAVTVPPTWKLGSQLSVEIPGGVQMLMTVPQGVKAGQQFIFELGKPPAVGQTSLQLQLQPAPVSRRAAAPKTAALTDLSFAGMLDFERKIREAMGKLRNTWKKVPRDILKMNGGTMLDAVDFEDGKFIPVAAAPKEKGWDPKNPNGFPAQKADMNNTNGVPGYTYTTNGELLGMQDQGEGYYQPKDPEHSEEYMRMLRLDCFGSGEKWRDHSNCAALIHRSHHYANNDPFRFSGAFGWNPPFPPNENNATNLKGAMPPDQAEYWNYGSDEDFSGAALWNGKKFAPPAPAAAASADNATAAQ